MTDPMAALGDELQLAAARRYAQHPAGRAHTPIWDTTELADVDAARRIGACLGLALLVIAVACLLAVGGAALIAWIF